MVQGKVGTKWISFKIFNYNTNIITIKKDATQKILTHQASLLVKDSALIEKFEYVEES